MNYINLLHDNNKQSLFSRPTANPAGSSSAAMHAVRKMTGTAERQEWDTPAKARRELPAKPPPFFYVLKYTIKANPSPNGNGFAFNLFGELSFEMSEHVFGGDSAMDLSPISSVFGGIRLR